MRYEVKRSDSAEWEPLTTESLASELASGRLRAHWKIKTEWESRVYSVEELCELQSATAAKRQADQARAMADKRGVKDSKPPSAALRRLFYFLSFYLIVTFLWRALTPAHEMVSRTVIYLSIAFDVLCLVGLVGLRMKLSRAAGVKERARMAPKLLFVMGLIAGLGLLGIRLANDTGWRTGHLRFQLRARG